MNTSLRRLVCLLPLAFGTVNAGATTVLIDFGNDDSFRGVSVPSPDDNGNYWNSVRPGLFFSNLVDITNQETDIDYGPGAHPTDSYNGPAGATDGGITETMLLTLDIDRIALGNLGVPEAAIDYHAGVLGQSSGYFQINGLDPSGEYTLRFFGSHKFNQSDSVRINVYDDPDRLNLLASEDFIVGTGSAHNTSTVVQFSDLVPSAGGIFYFEFGGADGVNSGYLNAMEVSTTSGGINPDPDPEPEPDEGVKLVVVGSSVPTGFAASLAGTYYHDYDQEGDTGKDYWDYAYGTYGYAGRLRLALTHPENPRVPGGSTTDWEFVNVSVPGDTTTLVRNRFDPDVTRQYAAPKTAHAEPQYVLIGLSLANEGLVFTSDPQSVFNSFRDGMLDIISKCEEAGYYPIITLVYPHENYTPEKYAFVKEMNLLMNTWGVTAINLLGAIDNGEGRWADGFVYDPGHPNFIGHEEMYHAIPPTLLDAIHFDGKRTVPDYPDSEGFISLGGGSALPVHLSYTPGDTFRAFTSSFKVRLADDGVLAAVRSRYEPAILVDFGPSNVDDGRPTATVDAGGNHWNNWAPTEGGAPVPAGTRLDNLTHVDGSQSAIALEVTTAFTGTNGLQNGGLFGAAGPQPELLGRFAVETATEDYFFSTSTSAIKITGLDPERRYTLRFFGTRAASESRETRYRVTGTTAEINFSPYADIITSGAGISDDGSANGNDSAIGLVSGIQPRANGEIFVEILPDAGGYAYLGAMEIRVDTASDRYATLAASDSALIYTSPDGRTLTVPGVLTAGNWHDVAISHRYAQQQTLLFVDGVEVGMLRENLEPDRFLLGSDGGEGLPVAPASADYQDWAVYRAAWTEDEAAAQSNGNLQHASMEVLSPLDDNAPADGEPLVNEAQTRSEVIFHGTEDNASYWSDVAPDPSSGARATGIGWIDDQYWPFLYHYGLANWLLVGLNISWGKDSFYAWPLGAQDWIWSSDAYGGWYYDFGSSQWMQF